MKHLSILAVTLFSILMCSCQSKKMKQTFYWSPALSCVHLYPMETYRCNFIYADGSGDSPIANLMDGVWGEDNGRCAVGEKFKPVPVRLDVTWLSYTENKFYTGSFKLPYDSILDLFKKGFEAFTWDAGDQKAYGRHDTYNEIIAGLAPGGVVVVWLNGDGPQIEVGRFQAKETSVDMKDFMQRDDLNVTKEQYAKSMIEGKKDVTDNLTNNGIPYGLWDKYRDRFNIKTVIKYDQHYAVKTDKLYMSFLNGENDVLFLDKVNTPEFIKRARIKSLSITWSDTLGFKMQPYILKVAFDEVEMFKAYKEVYGDDPNQEGELVIEVNRGNDQYRVFLQTKNKKVELLQDKGQIYFAQ